MGRNPVADGHKRETSDQGDRSFAEAEFSRLMMSDQSLRVLCLRSVQTFLPLRNEAAPVIAALLKNRLIEGTPTSLVRVGDGEGNALGMTRGAVHPVQLESFNVQFFNQVGTTLREDEARTFGGKILEAVCAADLIGFRWCDAPKPEFEMISNHLAKGLIVATLGMLYARALLQDELRRGRFKEKLITSAWIHLALIPYICDIMDAAKDVIVITSRDMLRPHFETRLGKRLRSFVVVPPEGYRPPLDKDTHYGKTFPGVLDALNTNLQGTLVLVGAGLLGKLYCNSAKNSGAVALDFGSSFDILAGMSTRPIHSSIDVNALRWV
jgi:hypothetical protein